MKYSIIIPSWNNVDFLFPCLQSVIRNTTDYEVVVVLNGCKDSSISLLNSLHESHPEIHFLNVYDRVCFSEAINLGFAKTTGENIILLNDDTLVTPGWADQLFACISESAKFYQVDNVGAVGPVSNNVGGNQAIEHEQINLQSLDLDSVDFHKRYTGASMLSGFLSGFCLLITRPCFVDVGPLEQNYLIGGWEDNDFCLRAYLKGWKFVIDRSTFIFHHGQKSLSRIGDVYTLRYRLNQLAFFDKFYQDREQRLTVITRIHNGMPYLKQFIDNIRTFADDLIVVCDRCTDGTSKYLHDCGFPCMIKSFDDELNENRDRQWLINTAVDSNCDWIISLDVDECMDASFTRGYAQRLMHPVNPEIQAYVFRFTNFWVGNSFYRTDGVFGRMTGLRMSRVTPACRIKSNFIHGLHCSHVPLTPFDYCRSVRSSILHYGYNTPEKRSSKYKFYTDIDKHPDPVAVGPEGYNHLISSSVVLNEYHLLPSLSLAIIIKNEEINLFSFLSRYYHFFDQIVVVDTGSTDKPEKVCELFGADFYTFKGKFDFSSARNFAKSKCTGDWILSMDVDEEIDVNEFPQIYDLLYGSHSAYLFQVANIMADGTIGYSDNVRLIKNIPKIYWSGFVHENVSKSVSDSHLTFGLAPFNIRHYGYLKPQDIQAGKSKLYDRLLRKDIKVNYKNAMPHFHMAFIHFERKEQEKGLAELELALQLQPRFFLAQKELGLHYLQKAIEYFKMFAKDVPEGHFFKNWSSEMLAMLEKAITTSPGKLL